MDAQANLRYYRSSPRKVRLVVDLVRGQAVEPALTSLQLCRKYAAHDVAKLVKSALANLEQAQPGVDVDRVFIRTITVDGGPQFETRPAGLEMGAVHRILKRICHITVELAVREN